MRAVSSPTAAPEQAPTKPPKIVIGGQLAVHWLRGDLQISPPSKRRREASKARHVGNGNGAATLSDEAIKRFVVQVGVERVRRSIDSLKQPPLPLRAAEAAP
jgi:hypothetical protein